MIYLCIKKQIMKKNLLLIFPLALVLFVAASCNKDQKAVKTLTGSWELVSQDGEAVPAEESLTYTFDDCKLKNDEYCNLTIEDADTTEMASYKVTDDGETLVLRTSLDGLDFDISNKIIELTSTTLKLEFQFIFTTILEFKKK